MLRIAAESLQMIIYQVDTRQFKERHNFEDFRIGGVDKLYKELEKIRKPKIAADVLSKYTILPHQKQILDKLSVIREGGK